MADPEEMLRTLAPEAPPPEIALAAVRVFRYRAVATVAILVAIVLPLAFYVPRLFPPTPERELADALTHGFQLTLADQRMVGEVQITLWSVVFKGSNGYAHLFARGGSQLLRVEVQDVTPALAHNGQPSLLTGWSTAGAEELWVRLPGFSLQGASTHIGVRVAIYESSAGHERLLGVVNLGTRSSS